MRLSNTALLAFFAVYIIWGSTYLAIAYAIETLPPWGLSAVRYLLAAGIMGAAAFFTKEAPLPKRQLKIAALSGPLLVAANGIVCVVEQWLPSGVAAVIIGAMPIWIMFIGWSAFGEARPNMQKVVGAIIGLLGISVIASGDIAPLETGASQYGTLFLILSSVLWATGTLVQRKSSKVESPLRFSAYQMGIGAIPVAALSLMTERPWALQLESVSTASLLALLYLVIFGSVVAFTAYSWLSRNVEPHLVSTYALVNPVIAVALGVLLLDEKVSARYLSGTVLVLIGIVFLTRRIRFRSAA